MALAIRGAELFNPASRTRVVFTTVPGDNGGHAMAVDWFVPRGETLPNRRHYHAGPRGGIAERFDILSGSAACTVAGRKLVLEAPAILEIPFNEVHSHPANAGEGELHVRQSAEPDPPQPEVLFRLERFFETLMALSQQGKVRSNGDIADPLQMALTFDTFLLDPTFLSGLPRGTQKALFGAMARLARLLGYHAYHEPDWKKAARRN
jgi:hypothetical protein